VTSVSHSGLFREFLAFVLIGAGLFVGGLGVLLIVGTVIGHGSFEGNILSMSLGLVLLILSAFLLIVGSLNWASPPCTEDVNN
jgi:hypothetical protein